MTEKLKRKTIYFLLLPLLAAAAVGYCLCLPRTLFDEPFSATVWSRDGRLMSAKVASDGQWRFFPTDSVTYKFRVAITTYEDKRFYRHFGVDPLALGVCDLAVVGVVISVLSVFLETPALPGTAKVWAASLFLGIVCSGICLVIQSVFQRHTTASRASLIFTLEPVFSAIFAFFLLGERIGVRGYLGAALMLASLVLVEVDVGALFKKGKKEAE